MSAGTALSVGAHMGHVPQGQVLASSCELEKAGGVHCLMESFNDKCTRTAVKIHGEQVSDSGLDSAGHAVLTLASARAAHQGCLSLSTRVQQAQGC